MKQDKKISPTYNRAYIGPNISAGVGDGIRTHDLQCHKLTR